MELHGDGYRYGTESDRHLPLVFEKVVEIITNRRACRQESTQGASEHVIVVADDLAQALTANAIFRHKVATHDLLSYSMKDPARYLAMITSEQLEHGGIMAQGSLMPTAAAEVIATTPFDFVLKHQLADTMQRMESAQIQMIALFVSHLLRKPPKRIHFSERWDLIQPKLKYTPVEDVASPETPHFARVIGEQDGAAEHSQAALPTMQAPVLCQLCGVQRSLAACSKGASLLVGSEEETHLRSATANQCATAAHREAPASREFHAGYALLLPRSQHSTAWKSRDETDRCMRHMCNQRLDR